MRPSSTTSSSLADALVLRIARAQQDAQRYEQAKRRLEASRRAGLDLVGAAYQAQHRAD
jgi:shikimate kinase